MVRMHFTKQSLVAASSLAALLALTPVAVTANPCSVPPIGPSGCVANCGTPTSTYTSGSSTPSSSSSSGSSSAARAAVRAAKIARQRQHQIQAKNFRLRSIDRARSKLTYPSIDNFLRSPSIDEQWQQMDGKIGSLKQVLADRRSRIDKVMVHWPKKWAGGGHDQCPNRRLASRPRPGCTAGPGGGSQGNLDHPDAVPVCRIREWRRSRLH